MAAERRIDSIAEEKGRLAEQIFVDSCRTISAMLKMHGVSLSIRPSSVYEDQELKVDFWVAIDEEVTGAQVKGSRKRYKSFRKDHPGIPAIFVDVRLSQLANTLNIATFLSDNTKDGAGVALGLVAADLRQMLKSSLQENDN